MKAKQNKILGNKKKYNKYMARSGNRWTGN
jgi:hypothetical protein